MVVIWQPIVARRKRHRDLPPLEVVWVGLAAGAAGLVAPSDRGAVRGVLGTPGAVPAALVNVARVAAVDAALEARTGGVDERVIAGGERCPVRVPQVVVGRHRGRVGAAAQVVGPLVAGARPAGSQDRHPAVSRVEDVDRAAAARRDLHRVAVAGRVVLGIGALAAGRAAIARAQGGGRVSVPVAGIAALREDGTPEALAAQLARRATARPGAVLRRVGNAAESRGVAGSRAGRLALRVRRDRIRVHAADAVVVQRTAHRDRQDELGARRSADRQRAHADHSDEPGIDLRRDRHIQTSRVAAVDGRGDHRGPTVSWYPFLVASAVPGRRRRPPGWEGPPRQPAPPRPRRWTRRTLSWYQPRSTTRPTNAMRTTRIPPVITRI